MKLGKKKKKKQKKKKTSGILKQRRKMYGEVSLFNRISTFVGYLIPELSL